MPNDIVGLKHKVQLYWSTSLEDTYKDKYVVIAVDDTILDGIGAMIYALGAQYPGNDVQTNKVSFNKDVTQRLMWLGLQLMGAESLSFTGSVTVSDDSEPHIIWTQSDTDKGSWDIEIQLPITEGGSIITSVEVSTLDCTEMATASFDAGVLSLGIPKGCDGSDGINGENGIDGVTPHFRVNSGFIQISIEASYTEWTDLIALDDLKGEDGIDGSDGMDGTNGTNGTNGRDGQGVVVPSEPTHSEDFNGQICAIASGTIKYIMDIYSDLLDAAIAKDDLGELDRYGWLKLIELVPVLGNAIAYYHDLNVLAESTGLAVSRAQDTTEFRDAATCVLYCLLKTANSTLITEDIFDDLITGVQDLPHDDSIEKVNTLFGMACNAIGFSVLGSRGTIFSDETSSACETLCEDCPDDTGPGTGIFMSYTHGSGPSEVGYDTTWRVDASDVGLGYYQVNFHSDIAIGTITLVSIVDRVIDDGTTSFSGWINGGYGFAGTSTFTDGSNISGGYTGAVINGRSAFYVLVKYEA